MLLTSASKCWCQFPLTLPMAALALSAMATASMRSISTLRGINVDCCTPIALCSLFEGTKDDRTDPSNNSQNLITVAHEIRKIFLVSDNQAFNRLFSFVGHRTINEAISLYWILLPVLKLSSFFYGPLQPRESTSFNENKIFGLIMNSAR